MKIKELLHSPEKWTKHFYAKSEDGVLVGVAPFQKYRVLRLSLPEKDMETRLNKEYEAGWHVVSCTYIGDGDFTVVLTFEGV